MNNFEKATIEYIYELLPREDCTLKEFRKAMGAIHNVTQEWAKFYIPRVSVAKRKACPECGGKDVRPYKDHFCCYECGEYLMQRVF